MYQLTKNLQGELIGVFQINGVGHIPLDITNTDYQVYLRWCEEGNTPLPAPEPEPVPEPTAAEKLAAAGLTVEELKELLGL
jgi:hypothetical protein